MRACCGNTGGYTELTLEPAKRREFTNSNEKQLKTARFGSDAAVRKCETQLRLACGGGLVRGMGLTCAHTHVQITSIVFALIPFNQAQVLLWTPILMTVAVATA